MHPATSAQVRAALRSRVEGLRLGLGAAAVALVIVGACSAGGTSAAPTTVASPKPAAATDSGPTAANPVTVTLGGALGGTPNVPLYVGLEQGIFIKHGIDLKLVTVPTPPDSPKMLQAGTIQFSGTTWAASVPAVAQGVPLRVLAMMTGKPDEANYDHSLSVVVGPGSTVKTIADLKGLRIASTAASNPEAYIKLLLQKAGLNPDKDATFVNTNSANLLATLQKKDVDAVSASEPYGTLIQMQLAGSRVIIQGGGVFEARSTLTVMDAWLKQNPVIADHFMAGLLEAQQYTRQHPTESGVALSHYASNVSVDVLTASLKKFDYDPRWSNTVLAGFEAVTQGLVASGTIKTAPKAADILVLDALTSFEKKYPQYFSDLK